MIDRVRSWLSALDAWSLRRRWPRVARRAVMGFLAHDALQYAGSMAYFSVLSIFQLLVLVVVIGSYLVGEGGARDLVVGQVQAGSPLDAATVAGVIDAVIESRGAMSVISIGFLLWSALGVFSALSNGIGRVFENAPKRPFLKDKLIGLLLMGLTGVLAIGSLVIGIVTGILQRAADAALDRIPGGETVVWLIGLVAPILLIFIAFWVIYTVVPNRPVRWGEALAGASVAALLWTILHFGFTWYATDVANYDSAFGPISTAITLLVFLYFASVIVLLGAEVARANVLDDEIDRLGAADPRFLPVAVMPSPPLARTRPPSVPRAAWIGIAAATGVVIGRLTKRSGDDV